MLIYTLKHSPRVIYTLKIILKQLLGLETEFIYDKNIYLSSEQPKLNYSHERIDRNEVFIKAASLLFEKNIHNVPIKSFMYEELPAFFKTNKVEADLPFDLFAASFYLLSRYEEYLPGKRDAFGRFPAGESLAYKEGFLQIPLVNHWALILKKVLLKKYPNLIVQTTTYRFQPTYDIDYAWSYINKGWIRGVGGYARDILKFDFTSLKARISTHLNNGKDPYYTFPYLEKLHKKYHLNPIWFFLMADLGKYDKNIPVENSNFQKLIQHIANFYEVGIHPSFASNNDSDLLGIEKNRLHKVTQIPIERSRQHFLMLHFPDTFENLLKNEVKEDYSLGYASEIGFRASIANSFPWYNLKKEEEAPLMLHPFQVMDVTLQQYLNYSPEKAIKEVEILIKATQKVGGTFYSLWHNSSFFGPKWEGWDKVYEAIISKAVSFDKKST